MRTFQLCHPLATQLLSPVRAEQQRLAPLVECFEEELWCRRQRLLPVPCVDFGAAHHTLAIPL